MTKILVLYVFYDYNYRVKHFINHTIFQDENIDFIIISNNKVCDFTPPSYVKKLYRDNIGFDFGGWSDALLNNNFYEQYDKFIFLNGSCLGPFMRPEDKTKWTSKYIDGLQNNIKLFGSTINTIDDPKNKAHVQSNIFALDKKTLEYLIKCGIFTTKKY